MVFAAIIREILCFLIHKTAFRYKFSNKHYKSKINSTNFSYQAKAFYG